MNRVARVLQEAGARIGLRYKARDARNRGVGGNRYGGGVGSEEEEEATNGTKGTNKTKNRKMRSSAAYAAGKVEGARIYRGGRRGRGEENIGYEGVRRGGGGEGGLRLGSCPRIKHIRNSMFTYYDCIAAFKSTSSPASFSSLARSSFQPSLGSYGMYRIPSESDGSSISPR